MIGGAGFVVGDVVFFVDRLFGLLAHGVHRGLHLLDVLLDHRRVGLAGEGEGGGGVGLIEAGEVGFRLAVARDLLGHLAIGQELVSEIDEGLLLSGVDGPADGYFVDLVDHLFDLLDLSLGHFAAAFVLLVGFVILLFEAVFHAGFHGLDRHLAKLLGDVLRRDAGAQVVLGW